MADFPTLAQIDEAVAYILSKAPGYKPAIGIVFGTGLDGLGDKFDDNSKTIVIPFTDIPYFIKTTVEGHRGNVLINTIAGVPTICLQGRNHFYEGLSMQKITFPIRVFARLGIKILILTNAAGSLIKTWTLGDIALVTDHINLLGDNPLVGVNKDYFPPHSVRFPDMSNCYDAELRKKVKASGDKLGIVLREGVYVAMLGPTFETHADAVYLQRIGCDMAGMSTAPECIIARHSGVKVVALSVQTDIIDTETPPNHLEILEVGRSATERIGRIFQDVLPTLLVGL